MESEKSLTVVNIPSSLQEKKTMNTQTVQAPKC